MKRGVLGPSMKEPADSRTIRKSTREESIDTRQTTVIDRANQPSKNTVHPNIVHPATVHLPSIDTVHPASINTVHPASIDTVLSASVDTVRPDTVHPAKNDTTCGEIEKIEVLILKVDKNGILRDEERRTRNSAGEFLDDVEATREKEKNDKWDRFLASLDEEYMIPIQLLDDIMPKRDEQHGFGGPSKVEEFDTSDSTSASFDSSTSESIDIGTSETIDTDFCHRPIPLEIPERSSCPQDIADLTHKSTDVSSCSPSQM
ncbi:hypothetical protein F2Q68_00004678 [Brassica cretica]|uniref:Uncharacterized protein n=1 Tax=Brassica cretica TaxID=69181 RepID=A0A8S9JHB9_BRACR|nr:hypothetical protein F2Q68_00004678 [Brassica cretica]